MLIFKTQEELKNHLQAHVIKHKTIGFVPTMGALHQGHLSLIEKSILENDYTVMSIFVNPTQFNNTSDLDNYPRTLDQDVNKLKQILMKAQLVMNNIHRKYYIFVLI